MASRAGKEASATPPRPSASDHDGASSVDAFDKDLAAAIVSDRARGFDGAAERSVVRKIDGVLIPWMWVGYGFVYYDKVRDSLKKEEEEEEEEEEGKEEGKEK